MKKRWHIEWYSSVPQQEGFDEVEALDVGEARRIYELRYPRRRIQAMSVIEPARAVLELARVE